MNGSFDAILQKFLDELQGIAVEHEEITDTDVSDTLHVVLNRFFVWAAPRDSKLRTFEMFSARGDELVARAVESFLDALANCREAQSAQPGQPRLDMLQNPKITTSGGDTYILYFGHNDTPLPLEPLPSYILEEGDYDDDGDD